MPGGQLGLFGPRHRQDAFVLSRKGDDETERVSWVRSLADGATPWHLVWISTTSSDRPGGSSTWVGSATPARNGGSGPSRARRASRCTTSDRKSVVEGKGGDLGGR